MMDDIQAPLHHKLLGVSAAIQELRVMVQRLAQSDLTVLITGESGTGKDIVARLLHNLSPRASKALIKVNCPAVPHSILESELFGYEKGAFTGARSSKPGRLELANQGTLFLDEIAETTIDVQGKLMQVLDGEPVLRIGGVQPIDCDVRIVAATNVALEKAVEEGRMRQDLFFRLAEVHVHLPPLRERREDIPVLAEHFNYNFRTKFGQEYKPLPEASVAQMQALAWPGNIRELSACVKKYVATSDPQMLLGDVREARGGGALLTPALPAQPERLPDSSQAPGSGSEAVRPVDAKPASPGPPEEDDIIPLKQAVKMAVERTERMLIEKALRKTLWNRRKAAKLLGISYSSLLRRIDQYGLARTKDTSE